MGERVLIGESRKPFDLAPRIAQAVAGMHEYNEEQTEQRRMAARLGDAPIDVDRGRATLKGLLGPIWISPRNGYLVAKMGLECQPLLGSSIRGSGGPLLIHLPTYTRSLRAPLTS